MRGLSRRIMEHADALPEAAPLSPAVLLYLGNRAAVDRSLSRLARSGRLMRICQSVYMRPIRIRFGIAAAARRSGTLVRLGQRETAPGGVQSLLAQPEPRV